MSGGGDDAERSAANDRLAAIGMMAAQVAHDLNNFLALTVTSLDLLQQDPANADAIHDLRALALRMRQLTADLLWYARPEPRARARDVDVAAVARAAIRLTSAEVKRRGARLIEHLDDGLRARVDELRLAQSIVNLVLNAAQAISPGRAGSIVVEARRSDDGFVLRVADDGVGIASEDLSRVGAPFFTTKPGGHGLGLPMVLAFARDHGGELEVRSAPGEGCTMTLRIPRGAG